MVQPGKIAFPVILVLGAITGYITYTLFTAAIPNEGTIDSPYYQPLPPASEGNDPGSTGGGGAAQQGGGGGGPTLTILEGSSIQGSPDYDPDELTVAAGSEVTVVNQDTLPHTVTSGTSPTDPNSAQLFDTSLINGGESATLSLAQVSAGQYGYYCMVHPYMTGSIVVQ
jgi:plastocyanin